MNRVRRHVLPGLLAVALLFGLQPARAQEAVSGSAQFVSQLGDRAIDVLRSTGALEQREASFRELLRQGFDLDFIGRFVVGRYAAGFTAEQSTEYQILFADYVLKTYSRRFGGYTGETLKVVGARAAGEQDTVVTTRIDRPSGPPINCDWRVRAYAGGQYRIIDVTVEGVSMALTQRQEFASLMSNGGPEALLVALRARADHLPAAR